MHNKKFKGRMDCDVEVGELQTLNARNLILAFDEVAATSSSEKNMPDGE